MSDDRSDPFVKFALGDSPIVATALHDGHLLRNDVRTLMALSDSERLREEDPFTGRWTRVAATRLVAGRSRFEVDLNRPRDHAVYEHPEEAWGLHVWKRPPSPTIVENSLWHYDSFYELLQTVLNRLVERHRRVAVLDLHTYNHRRGGANQRPADPRESPDVNIGTGSMPREYWAPLVDRLISDLSTVDFEGRHLDVRENVCFQGGQMSRWIHDTFTESVCSISIEFKKFFMDEWTGTADDCQVAAIEQALASTIPGLSQELRRATELRRAAS